MTREQILAEIRRTAVENGGEPLGYLKFAAVTGIRRHEWRGKHWTKWSDAVREAGLDPNPKNEGLPEDALLESLAALAREVGRFPGQAEILMKRQTVPEFPGATTFRRLGRQPEQAAKLHAYALRRDYADVAGLCMPLLRSVAPDVGAERAAPSEAPGYVYLFQHGARREFKIGRTNNRLRREGEVRLELPHDVSPIHVIETDDPAGVENYWHRRFDEKRLQGEWFVLTPNDVRAFRRWRKIF